MLLLLLLLLILTMVPRNTIVAFLPSGDEQRELQRWSLTKHSPKKETDNQGEKETRKTWLGAFTLLEPQSRFGDKLLRIRGICPHNKSAVLSMLFIKGL